MNDNTLKTRQKQLLHHDYLIVTKMIKNIEKNMTPKIFLQSKNVTCKVTRQIYLHPSRYFWVQKHENCSFFLKNPISIYREE